MAKTDNWNTPKWLMDIFKDYFDPCPPSPTFDGLNIDWKDRNYINPPYSNPLLWVRKAIEESKKGKICVLLLRADNSTKWFKELMLNNAHILFFGERLHFNESKNSPNFASTLFILNGEKDGKD